MNFVFVVRFDCGEFLQNVNLSAVVNKATTHQSSVIRKGTVLPYVHVLYTVIFMAYF